MLFWKKHLFKIVLLLILLAAGYWCISSVLSYHGNSANLTDSGNRNSSRGNGERPSFAPRQAPEGNQPGQRPAQESDRRNDINQSGVNRDKTAMPPSEAARAHAHNDYSSQLFGYTIIFFGLFIVLYCLFIRQKLKIDSGSEKFWLIALLALGLFLRIYCSTLMEGHSDIMLFKNWAAAAANNLLEVYSHSNIDYPPLYLYILALIGKIAGLPAISPYYTLLLKLPAILADIATSLLIFKLGRKYLAPELSLLLSAFYLFNPAIFINSAFWGQVDSFFTLILVLAVLALSENRIRVSSALFAAAVLMKPQGIIFLPVLCFELLRRKSLKDWLEAVLFALGTAAIIVIPFSLHKDMLWIFKLYSSTVGEYPYASVNAFNLFSLLGANYKNDAAIFFIFSYHTWGLIFITLVTAFSWFIYTRRRNSDFAPAAALFQIAGVFTLATGMHERYLFPAIGLTILGFIYLRDKRLWLLLVGYTATVFINTQAILFQGTNSAAYTPVLIITSLINIVLLIYLGKVLFDIAVKKREFTYVG